MSAEPSREDLRACSTLLNTLHAEHQGAAARMTVLGKLGHESVDAGELAELQGRIREISGWARQLWDREPVFRADGSGDDAVIARALDLLEDLTRRHEAVGREMERALDAVEAHEHDGSETPEAALVLGGQAWAAYSYENELRGVIHHGQTLDDAELADRALQQLPLAQDGLRVLHHLLDRISEPGPPGCDLLAEIHRGAAHLPGVFGVKADAIRGLIEEIRELRA